jgi:hypothetical protein
MSINGRLAAHTVNRVTCPAKPGRGTLSVFTYKESAVTYQSFIEKLVTYNSVHHMLSNNEIVADKWAALSINHRKEFVETVGDDLDPITTAIALIAFCHGLDTARLDYKETKHFVQLEILNDDGSATPVYGGLVTHLAVAWPKGFRFNVISRNGLKKREHGNDDDFVNMRMTVEERK